MQTWPDRVDRTVSNRVLSGVVATSCTPMMSHGMHLSADFSVQTSDGKHAIRVRLLQRRTLSAPSCSTTGQKGEPRLDLLRSARTTHLVYGQSEPTTAHYDDWRAADPAHRLPETWAGEAIFEVVVATPRATASSTPGATLPQFPMDEDGD